MNLKWNKENLEGGKGRRNGIIISKIKYFVKRT